MAASKANRKNRIIVFVLATVVTALALYFYLSYLDFTLPTGEHAKLQKIPLFVLAALLGYLFVRALNAAIFDLMFRFRRGYEAPTLARNVFTLFVFAVVFVILFRSVYGEYDLGALFTTSAIFGVIIGLALQDTLGNFFAGISLHADRPFQVGDVIVVGSHVGVVESINWRAIKLRTFTNHIVLVSNTSAARESIEVSPRNNLNARLVFSGRSIPTRRQKRSMLSVKRSEMQTMFQTRLLRSSASEISATPRLIGKSSTGSRTMPGTTTLMRWCARGSGTPSDATG
jgi:small-conductance mechanosensitive channel